MLMAFWEVQRLTREIHKLECQAIKKRIELTKHQKYVDSLAKSSVMSLASVAGLSPDYIPRAMMFAQFADQASSMQAFQNLQMVKMMGGFRMYAFNPQYQQFAEWSALNKFKEQSLKALKQQEVDYLNEIEAQIQLEMNTIETRIKEKRAMLDSCKKLLDEEVRDGAPKFGL